MGTLYPYIGATKMLITTTGVNTDVTDISGTTFTNKYYTNSSDFYKARYNYLPFCLASEGTYTAASNTYLFPYASSDSSCDYSQTSLTNTIGSCSISYTRNSDSTGWNANITITGTEEATVNSLQFTKSIYVYYSSAWTYLETLVFAYILDSPIELNSDNSYTANLTMSIAFTE